MYKFFFNIFFLFFSQFCYARPIIDCRVITGAMTECNPYGKKLHMIKEVSYDVDRHKLIIVKTLPVTEHKNFLKIISVAEMIEKHVKVEKSVRFKDRDSLPMVKVINEERKAIQQVLKANNIYGFYTVVKGDSLSRIANKFDVTVKKLTKINTLENISTLQIGQKIKVPFEQKMSDAIASAKYTVNEGETLLSIAKMFKLLPKDIVMFNKIKDATTIRKGKVLKLPLPYVVANQAKQNISDNIGLNFDINSFGTHKLRVTSTAYSSHGNQTDDTPFLAAWNNKLRPGMKIIAVSRDLLSRFGMRNGTKVRIGGLRGIYRVRDKMNKRYRKHIDIYMGLNLHKALKWGRRSVVIYW